MRHFLVLLVLGLSLNISVLSHAWARYASIVIDAESGDILYANNPDKQNYPASLTKMMTLHMLFDALKRGQISLNQRLPVSAHAASQSPSKLGLRPGQTISVENVILGLVTRSANDAAVVAAEGLGGTEANFAVMMTQRARDIGMTSSVFRNASGLPNPGQLSTARDMAALGRSLIYRHGDYYHYFSTRSFVWQGQQVMTHNRLMLRYDGADGIKTGYIGASGFNLVASAKRNGRRIIAAVFGGSSASARDDHMIDLLDLGFANLAKGVRVAAGGEKDNFQTVSQLTFDQARRNVSPGQLSIALADLKTPAKPIAKAPQSAKSKPQPASTKPKKSVELANWSVQIGSFNSKKQATTALRSAIKSLGPLGRAAKQSVQSAKVGGKVTYRARLVGLSQEKAQLACVKLEKSGRTCMPINAS